MRCLLQQAKHLPDVRIQADIARREVRLLKETPGTVGICTLWLAASRSSVTLTQH
jgi:hypothetical protein